MNIECKNQKAIRKDPVKPFILCFTFTFIKLNWGQKSEYLAQNYIAHWWDMITRLATPYCLFSGIKDMQIYIQE